MEDKELNMNIHPLEVYQAWINATEAETGEPSKLPRDVTPEQVKYSILSALYIVHVTHDNTYHV